MTTRRSLLETFAAFAGLASGLLPARFAFSKAAREFSQADQSLALEALKGAAMLFWDCGHPVSGMIADRIPFNDPSAGNINVVTGATGFGCMLLPAAVDRGWLTREEVTARLDKIVSFLEKAETWHGVFPHQMHGTTGKIVPFAGDEDNGGDTVETAFLMMGLLTARQFLLEGPAPEKGLCDRIDTLWKNVNWRACVHAQYGKEHLFWIDSPVVRQRLTDDPVKMQTHARAAEGLAAVMMGSMSPNKDHALPPHIYRKSAMTAADFTNSLRLYGYKLGMGPLDGGALFPKAYIATAFDPHGLKLGQTTLSESMWRHAQANMAHSRDHNYGPLGWCLSDTDDVHGRYGRHSMSNDDGTFNPPMAMAYFSIVPEESLRALSFLRDSGLWGRYGPVSAYNLHWQWRAKDILVLDFLAGGAGIANGLDESVWRRFRKCPELQNLALLGIRAPYIERPGARLIASAAPSP